jgi:hypothetical protein
MKKNMQERVMSLLLFVGAIMVVVIITSFSSGFSITKQSDRITEISAPPAVPVPLMISTPVQDTIRDPEKHEPIEEDMEAARIEAMEEIDWDQMKREIEESIQEIDLDDIRREIRNTRHELDSLFIEKDI